MYVMKNANPNLQLAASITKAASKQTYYTIRFLADRDRMADAYRAYAYFRWVDDVLDAEAGTRSERSAFLAWQQSILESCYRGQTPRGVNPEERMLVELVRSDEEKSSGLQSYLRNMMAVMAFDAERRGRVVSQSELNAYTRGLASAVTEAMHYFIGHCCYSPRNETRYLAVSAAHVTHMLRDTFGDVQAGYYNIPREVLDANHITPQDIQSNAYRAWVRGRVELARSYFNAGRQYLDRVENLRCRLAGYAYIERFAGVLDSIEREGYLLRAAYPARKGLGAIIRASGSIFTSLIFRHDSPAIYRSAPVREHSLE